MLFIRNSAFYTYRMNIFDHEYYYSARTICQILNISPQRLNYHIQQLKNMPQFRRRLCYSGKWHEYREHYFKYHYSLVTLITIAARIHTKNAQHFLADFDAKLRVYRTNGRLYSAIQPLMGRAFFFNQYHKVPNSPTSTPSIFRTIQNDTGILGARRGRHPCWPMSHHLAKNNKMWYNKQVSFALLHALHKERKVMNLVVQEQDYRRARRSTARLHCRIHRRDRNGNPS